MTEALQINRLATSVRWLKKLGTQLVAFERSRLAYVLDFFIYGCLLLVLTGFVAGDLRYIPWTLAVVLTGILSWTFLEYVLHRYVLHSIEPFRRWHEAHHQQPRALICTPTIISLSLFVVLLFLPAVLLMGVRHAAQLQLGVLAGYFFYSLTHHAAHHWRGWSYASKRRKTWHAFHHHSTVPICFGVTTRCWDYFFDTAVTDTKCAPDSNESSRH